MYKEFDVISVGHEGKKEPITLVRGNISYYRSYTQTSDKEGSENDKLISVIYMVGSTKGIRVYCGLDELKRKIKNAE